MFVKKEDNDCLNYYATQKFRFSGELNPFYGKNHTEATKKKMRDAWRVRRAEGRINSENQKKAASIRFKGKHLSKEHKEKIRDGVIRAYQNGNAGPIKGKFWSKKNYSWIYYRSSYEKVVFFLLEKMNMVAKYEVELIKIPYKFAFDKIRIYLPDILITYKDGSKELVEIKPDIIARNDATFAKKRKAAHKYCEAKGFNFSVWGERMIFTNKLRKHISLH